MTELDRAIERYLCNAEYERVNDNLQGCLEFRQLCEWLKELKAYHKICHKDRETDEKTADLTMSEVRIALGVLHEMLRMLSGEKPFLSTYLGSISIQEMRDLNEKLIGWYQKEVIGVEYNKEEDICTL